MKTNLKIFEIIESLNEILNSDKLNKKDQIKLAKTIEKLKAIKIPDNETNSIVFGTTLILYELYELLTK